MPAASAGARAIIRLWFRRFLYRNPKDSTELNGHYNVFIAEGPGKSLTRIVDSMEARHRQAEDEAIRKWMISQAIKAGFKPDYPS